MANESPFVGIALEVARETLSPPLHVERGEVLIYQISLDDQLEPTIDFKNPPKRGSSAFQTDLCVFEKKKGKNGEVSIPRVVMEFKTSITTHVVLTYDAKAAKHKRIYPYLRYGIVASNESTVPGRLFTHNESLDFCAAVKGLSNDQLREFFRKLLTQEVETSRRLERIAFDNIKTRLFRTETEID